MEMCRACLSTQSEMLRINSDCLQNYILLTNLKIDIEKNNLPQYMCRNCWDTIEAFIDFRNKCIATEASLSLILNNGETDSKTTGMKSEQKETDADDNVDVKLEIEDDDYLNFDEDYITSEIKYEEIQEIEISTEKETKRKRGRPRKNAVNPAVQIEKTLLDSSLSCVIKETKRKRGRPNKHFHLNPDYVQTVKNISDSPLQSVKKETKRKIGRPNKNVDKPAHALKDKNLSDSSLPCGLCKNTYEDRDSLHNHLEKHKKGTVCSICKKDFKPWPQLMAHRINHIDESKRRCHICFKMFRVDFYLEYHYLTTHYDKEFSGIECKICKKISTTARRMKGHMWSQHSNKKYICDYCGKEYPNKSNLLSHILQHSNKDNYFCDSCSFSCKRLPNLKAHILRLHTAVKYNCKCCKRVFPSEVRLDKHNCIKGICTVCGKECSNKSLRHIVIVHTKVKYNCKECRRYFPDQRRMDKHKCRRRCVCPTCGLMLRDGNPTTRHKLKMHTKDSYRCNVCYQYFDTALRVETHTCNTYQICTSCGKRMRRSALARHMTSHSDERSFKCSFCPSTFKGRSTLKVHEFKHKNVRPHKCEYCSMRFFTSAVRNKHQRVHTGERPFVCKMCGKGFTGNHNLKVHMKVHGLDLVVKRGTEKTSPQQIFPTDFV